MSSCSLNVKIWCISVCEGFWHLVFTYIAWTVIMSLSYAVTFYILRSEIDTIHIRAKFASLFWPHTTSYTEKDKYEIFLIIYTDTSQNKKLRVYISIL